LPCPRPNAINPRGQAPSTGKAQPRAAVPKGELAVMRANDAGVPGGGFRAR
jgi:hypothetical protein